MTGILNELEKDLSAFGWKVEYFPNAPDKPFGHLTADLPVPDLNWLIKAELFVINDLEPGSKPVKAGDLTADPQFIQVTATLPCFVAEQNNAEMLRFIGMINNVTPLMGFCFTEATAQVYFRYVLPVLHAKADAEFLDGCLDAIQYSIDTFGEAFQDLAVGNRSLEQIVAADIYWK